MVTHAWYSETRFADAAVTLAAPKSFLKLVKVMEEPKNALSIRFFRRRRLSARDQALLWNR